MSLDRVTGNYSNRSRVPKKWSDYMIATYYSDFVVPRITNTDYEGDFQGVGDTIVIPKRTKVTSRHYKIGEELIVQDDLIDESVTMSIDYGDYFAVGIDDVDTVLQIGDEAKEIFDEGTRSLGETLEKRILQSIYASATSTVTNSDLSGSPAMDSSNALKFFLLASMKMNQLNVPMEDRVAVIDPITAYFLNLSDLKAAYITADGGTPLRTGIAVDKPVAGFQVYISNYLNATASLSHLIFAHKDAISFAAKVNTLETVRREKHFGDLLRGLAVYGYKALQPDGIVHGNITSFGAF